MPQRQVLWYSYLARMLEQRRARAEASAFAAFCGGVLVVCPKYLHRTKMAL